MTDDLPLPSDSGALDHCLVLGERGVNDCVQFITCLVCRRITFAQVGDAGADALMAWAQRHAHYTGHGTFDRKWR